MNKKQIKALEELNIVIAKPKLDILEKYEKIFLEKNSKVNLISKNDEKILFEKHIYDSLAINKFLSNFKGKTLMDIGTGGGFPSVPIAIMYEELSVYAVDSIRKKIKVIEEIKDELGIKNLFPICDRVENIPEKFDYITSRAVASLDIILKYAVPKLKTGGYFIAYKSKKALEELSESKKTIKRLGVEVVDIVEYVLPLVEIFERNLIIFKKQ